MFTTNYNLNDAIRFALGSYIEYLPYAPVAFVISLALLLLLVYWSRLPPGKERKMGKRRKDNVRRQVENFVEEGLDGCLRNRTMNETEVEDYKKQFSRKMGLELMPQRLKGEDLKAEIIHKMGSGFYKPVKFPDPDLGPGDLLKKVLIKGS